MDGLVMKLLVLSAVYLAFAFQKLDTAMPDEDDFSLAGTSTTANRMTESSEITNQNDNNEDEASNQEEPEKSLKRKHSDSNDDDEAPSESKSARRSVSPPTLVTWPSTSEIVRVWIS